MPIFRTKNVVFNKKLPIFVTMKEIMKLEPGLTLKNAGYSSLDVIELVFEIEEHYGIGVSDADMSAFRTVGDIQEFINNLNK